MYGPNVATKSHQHHLPQTGHRVMCQSAPFRIVASDMDGTVLNSDHEITEYTMETLFQLFLHYNVQFIFATGRHYLSVHKAREELSTYFAKRSSEYRRSVKSHPCGEGDNPGTGKYVVADSTQPGFFLVTSNGARIHDTKGKLIVSHDLDPDIVKALYQHYGLPYTSRHGPKAVIEPSVGYSPHVSGSMEAAANGLMKGGDKNPEDIVSTSAYTTDEWFLTALFMPLPDIEKKFGVRPFLVPFDSEDPESASASVFNSFPLEGVGKVCFRCSDPSILDEMERSIRQQFGDRVSVALSSTRCLDVMPGNISKASALQEIVKLLSSESAQGHHNTRPPMLKDIIAFGDSMNDEAMLKTVGKGCIMENAHDRLKKTLSNCEVIGSNAENGVAVKLREIFQISLDP